LIPFVVTVALLGLGMCRLAAHSDSSQALALAEWAAANYRGESEAAAVQWAREQIPFEPRRGAFRATG
jgi:hypothetical protein